MSVTALCVLVAALVGSVVGELSPPSASYRVLMLLPVSTRSHLKVFMPLAMSLADRGHEVVMLTNHLEVCNHPNITQINHGLPYYREENVNIFSVTNSDIYQFDLEVGVKLARDLYKVKEVKQLYDRRKEFDVIIVNAILNEIVYPFVHEVPFMTLATLGVDPRQSAVLGNVLNPAYVPELFETFPSLASMWDRGRNAAKFITKYLSWRYWEYLPGIQKEMSAQFPELPPLLEIERNQSLVLLNSHFSISMTLPLLPSQVEVGAMHCRPATPLPKTLEYWIEGAGPAGVIYFSLGSFTLGTFIPVEYRNLLVEAFRRLPQRVLWKYEGNLEGVPDNVLIQKWFPQQDILGHSNVKVFISHGGLLSLQEAIYHATPLLVLPIFADQPKNGIFVKTSGLGDMLRWQDLTSDAIVNTITEIINNPKFKENLVALSKPLRDQLETPQERAVFWTEYVIRNRGAPLLRCSAADLSWVEFLMLDVAALLMMAALLLCWILRHVLRVIWVTFTDYGHHKKID